MEMKPLNLNEARNLALAEKNGALKAANKESARALILQMMASLPKPVSAHAKSFLEIKADLHSSMQTQIQAGSGRR